MTIEKAAMESIDNYEAFMTVSRHKGRKNHFAGLMRRKYARHFADGTVRDFCAYYVMKNAKTDYWADFAEFLRNADKVEAVFAISRTNEMVVLENPNEFSDEVFNQAKINIAAFMREVC